MSGIGRKSGLTGSLWAGWNGPLRKTIILSAALAGTVMVAGCNTRQSTWTTTTSDTHRAATAGDDSEVKIINGKRYVFIRQELGSNIPGRWVLESSAEAQLARQAGTIDRGTIQRTQDFPGQTLDQGGAKAVPGPH